MVNNEILTEFMEEFKLTNVQSGAYNIFVSDDSSSIGYKLFFREHGGPGNFRAANTDKNTDLLDGDDLELFFKFMCWAYKINIYPKTHHIFTYKSITGMVVDKVEGKAKNMPADYPGWEYENGRNGRPNVDFRPMVILEHAGASVRNKGAHNWGWYNNRLTLIDLDICDFEGIQRPSSNTHCFKCWSSYEDG